MNSRAGAPIRSRKAKERVRRGEWENPSPAFREDATPEEIETWRARVGAGVSRARQREVEEGRWRNPALDKEARRKLSRPRKHGDNPVLHSAIEKTWCRGVCVRLDTAGARSLTAPIGAAYAGHGAMRSMRLGVFLIVSVCSILNNVKKCVEGGDDKTRDGRKNMNVLIDKAGIQMLDRIDQTPVNGQMRYYYVPRNSVFAIVLVSRVGPLETLAGRVMDAAVGWAIGWHGKCHSQHEGMTISKLTLFREASAQGDVQSLTDIMESTREQAHRESKKRRWSKPFAYDDQ